jgi:hypothetical protein
MALGAAGTPGIAGRRDASPDCLIKPAAGLIGVTKTSAHDEQLTKAFQEMAILSCQIVKCR